MDIAMILDGLVPGAKYGGVPGSTEAEYAALRWYDDRTQPSWEEVDAAWPEVERKMLAERNKPDELALLKERIVVLELKTKNLVVAEI